MQLKCIQTAHVTSILQNNCKTVAQIHQVHAQAITSGLFSIDPVPLFTRILRSATFLPIQSQSAKISCPIDGYTAKIFNLIPNPSTLNYNCIIRACAIFSTSPSIAFGYFKRMRRESVSPDFYTFPFVLKACGLLGRVVLLGETLHSELLKFGFLADVFVCNSLACMYRKFNDVGRANKVFDESLFRDVVTYNAIIDGYVKAGDIENGRMVFDQMPVRDSVSWGTLLAGYAKFGYCVEAIDLYDKMVDLRVNYDNVALVSVLSACAQLGELMKGKKIHDRIERNGVRLDSYLGTALVDMYAKCGCIDLALEVFDSCPVKNVPLWNAMLFGLAVNGNGGLSLQYFSRMVEEGVRPDGVTILGVLVGCSHSGLINVARGIFQDMESVYGVPREMKHYGCMADLLGRAGLIKEAVELIEAMPMRGDVFVWGGLLGGCKIHGNLEMAENAANRVMEVKPEDGGVYSVLAHMYANAERWDDLAKVRRLRDCRWGIKKSAGCSLIDVDGIRHEFVSGDSLHPRTDEIYLFLNGLEIQVSEAF